MSWIPVMDINEDRSAREEKRSNWESELCRVITTQGFTAHCVSCALLCSRYSRAEPTSVENNGG